MRYCALCCIAKDEDRFLKEWLCYHALIGFEHFFIYDNLSALPVATLLEGWASPSQLTIIRPEKALSQEPAYTHCLQHFGGEYHWMAFLDVDEFIRLHPAEGELADIRIFLAEFEAYAALGLNWRIFSSSGHETAPEGPVIGAYTRSFGDDAHIKSIVQPRKIRACANPHAFYPNPGEHAVNAARFPIPPGFPFAPPATDKVAVNHYFYKSRECFAHKIAKGNPCNIERRMQDFDQQRSMPDECDDGLAALAPRVSALLRDEKRKLLTAGMPKPLTAPSPADGASPPAKDSRSAAQDCLASARSALSSKKIRQALLHLCYAALHNEREGKPDTILSLDIWTLRAEAALMGADMDLAEHCLRQALALGAGRKSFALLADILLRRNKYKEAKAVMGFLNASTSKYL